MSSVRCQLLDHTIQETVRGCWISGSHPSPVTLAVRFRAEENMSASSFFEPQPNDRSELRCKACGVPLSAEGWNLAGDIVQAQYSNLPEEVTCSCGCTVWEWVDFEPKAD
jgi:hypothetical protein